MMPATTSVHMRNTGRVAAQLAVTVEMNEAVFSVSPSHLILATDTTDFITVTYNPQLDKTTKLAVQPSMGSILLTMLPAGPVYKFPVIFILSSLSPC